MITARLIPLDRDDDALLAMGGGHYVWEDRELGPSWPLYWR